MHRSWFTGRWIVAAALPVCAAVAWAADPLHQLKVGQLTVSIPWSAEWQERAPPSDVVPGTAAFGTADKLRLEVLLSTGPANAVLQSDAAMAQIATDMVKVLLMQSVETELPLQRIATDQARGYYVCATDRAPKPGESKYVCQGILTSAGLPFSFTVLFNDRGLEDSQKAITALKSLQVSNRT